jgi:hypothetical protein
MARVPKTTRKEHQTPKRVRFRCIVEQGETQAETATKWIKRRNSDRRTSKRTGRPPIITGEKVEEMIKWMTGYYERRVLSLQDIAKAHGIKACDNTIAAAFARYGYHYHTPDCKPFLSKATKLKRWTFSIQNWDRPKEYWRRGLYCDESTVQTNTHQRQKLLRKRGERRRLDCIQFTFTSGRESVHCWAVIRYNFKSPIIFLSRICGRFCCLSSEKRAFVLALLAVDHLVDPTNSQTRLVSFVVLIDNTCHGVPGYKHFFFKLDVL